MEPITAYRAFWHAESNTGRLYLQLGGPGKSIHLEVDSPAELNAMVDLLRSCPDSSYDAESRMICTAWKAPGR